MFFNNFDYLSPHITLYFKDRKRHLSPLGGFLTLIMIISLIYIIINYTILNVSTKSSSLIIYRNFEIEENNNYFNESGLFHFIYIYKDENLLNNNDIQLNNFKKGIIRIYMTYTYDKYEYNSSNLGDNDHWVYDTCHSYVNRDDLKYDYSYSSCIKYYYNSIDKKYYSIHDTDNFKWPYLRDNINEIKNKTFFATFIEKCSNNSLLNEILGDCYPEEKINQYLSNFNNIFISFVNNKIDINDKEKKIKAYSHKIYDNLINNGHSFFSHELKFTPFNFEERKNILSKKIVYNSFMFNGEKASKKNNIENNNLLLVYIYHFKKYIDEYREPDNYILQSLHKIGGTIALIYYIFYFLNYFINKRIEIRNFQKFLNDKGDNTIHRHINYEKHKIYSLKSNIYTNISNEVNEQHKSFKSTYNGNLTKNDANNIYNTNNNTKLNENNLTLNLEKIKNVEKDEAKKSNNIIVINNGTFMNNDNASNNSKLNLSISNTIDNLKSVSNNINKNFEPPEVINKIYTFTRGKQDQEKSLISFGNTKNEPNFINLTNYAKNKNLEVDNADKSEIIDLGSKQKIMDASSISLLNYINKTKNIYNNNSNYNMMPKKEISLLNFDKNSESFSPKSPKINRNQKHKRSSLKDNYSQNDCYMNQHIENMKNSFFNKNNKKNILMEKYNKIFISTSTNDIKRRRQSYQPRNTLRKEYENDNENEKHKYKNRRRRKTGVFNLAIDKNRERRLSLFSKNSNNLYNNGEENNNKSINFSHYDNFSQNNLSRNLIEHYKKIVPMNQFMSKKEKEIISPGSELRSKNQKRDNKNPMKNENTNKQVNQFTRIIQDINWTPKSFWSYLCLCRLKEKDDINILNKFRQKLLSEEYLYILHFNMFIFKQKLGCKSYLEKTNLLEELYHEF